MNGSAACHEIEGVPGLYVDAFRGALLRKTSDAQNAFILTHYHGDHYGSLPRDGKYQGPALIHCTPVTAALLRKVHNVPECFVVEHAYGKTWTHALNQESTTYQEAHITFYDANHCPGAAIVTIQLPDGKVHLHTGDMRYHPKMKSYPVLQDAVRNKKLDLLYLDTTYGHPKHDFVPQEVAVNSIASQIHELLSAHGQCGGPRPGEPKDPNKPRVLILLSCYSIGKEKVLWESAQRSNQLVYVTEKKLNMMNCIQSHDPNNGDDCQNNIIEKCTRDPNATDLHVIRMGLAGELWPYFRPNYRNCVDYEEELEQNYDKIVAFIPTGWANGSNWNKKNAISKRQLECRRTKNRFVDVEIRLISYSEHSAFCELEAFVEYCRPRRVVPTVFGDANDCRRLEKLFRKYVDASRAKLQFFQGMTATKLVQSKAVVESKKKNDQSPSQSASAAVAAAVAVPASLTPVASSTPVASTSSSTAAGIAASKISYEAKFESSPLFVRSEQDASGQITEKESQQSKKPEGANSGDDDCIDLTLSSDDEDEPNKKTQSTESNSPLSDTHSSPTAVTSMRLDQSALGTKSLSPPQRRSSSTAKALPTKRKRASPTGKNTKIVATPSITQFFSKKAK